MEEPVDILLFPSRISSAGAEPADKTVLMSHPGASELAAAAAMPTQEHTRQRYTV